MFQPRVIPRNLKGSDAETPLGHGLPGLEWQGDRRPPAEGTWASMGSFPDPQQPGSGPAGSAAESCLILILPSLSPIWSQETRH